MGRTLSAGSTGYRIAAGNDGWQSVQAVGASSARFTDTPRYKIERLARLTLGTTA